jgi:menaquinone-dependent protoporphyrinogen oxidase
MNTLIAYASKHGATKAYAGKLAELLPGQVTLVDLKQNPGLDLTPFDQVVIGSAIYAGTAQKEVRAFCAQNLEQLKRKRLGLFICCLFDGPQGEQQLQQAFPAELRTSALALQRLSGNIDMAGLNFLERQMSRLVGVKASTFGYSEAAVRTFAAGLAAGQ